MMPPEPQSTNKLASLPGLPHSYLPLMCIIVDTNERYQGRRLENEATGAPNQCNFAFARPV